jgi:hypothetical protein
MAISSPQIFTSSKISISPGGVKYVSMTRNEMGGGGSSNYSRPDAGPWRYYEMSYKTVGPQEWIFLPDVGKSKVVLMFPFPGAAFIEGSCSPVEDILQNIADPTEVFSPGIYPLTDTVQDTTQLLVEGETAIRVNVVGGTNIIICVRC